MLIANLQDQDIDATEEQVDPAIEQHQVAVCERIFESVGLFLLTVVAEQEFQPDDDDVDRGAYENEYLFPEVFHCVKINQITHLCSGVLLMWHLRAFGEK